MPIRRLRPEDAAPYRATMLEAYAAHPQAFTSSTREREALPLSWWQDRLSSSDDARECVLGAFEADALVGVAGVSFQSREKTRHKCTVFGMYVRPAHRRRRLGDHLLQGVLELARLRPGVMLAQLTVTEGNPGAVALYERHGFIPFGVEPFAVSTPAGLVTKLHLWQPLHSEGAVRPATPRANRP